jgi:hypothetical protein
MWNGASGPAISAFVRAFRSTFDRFANNRRAFRICKRLCRIIDSYSGRSARPDDGNDIPKTESWSPRGIAPTSISTTARANFRVRRPPTNWNPSSGGAHFGRVLGFIKLHSADQAPENWSPRLIGYRMPTKCRPKPRFTPVIRELASVWTIPPRSATRDVSSKCNSKPTNGGISARISTC